MMTMSDTSICLSSSQAHLILDLCKTIKNSPNFSNGPLNDTATLATQVEDFAAAAINTAVAEENDHTRRVMLQNASYAETKIEEATNLVNKADDAVTKAKEALGKAKTDMASYYMLKDVSVEGANTRARKAMIEAGLAILELDFGNLS
jgi:hypothetical protein